MTQIETMTDNRAEVKAWAGGEEDLLLRRLLETKELRAALSGALPAILDLWARNRAFRKMISQAALRHLQKGLMQPGRLPEPHLSDLFNDPRFVANLLRAAAPMAPAILESTKSALSAMETLSPDAQAALVSEIMASAKLGGSGMVLSEAARFLNRLHAADPLFFSKNLAPAIRRFIEETDFGEFREAADASKEDLIALLTSFLDTLFAYPGKVLLLLSFVPDILSAVGSATEAFLSRLNALPPDLLCDVLLSYAERIDPQAVSQLINESAELLRKIQTGSALLGEPGAARLGIVLSETVDRIVGGMDKEVLLKAAAAGGDIQSAWHDAITAAVEKDPDLMAGLASVRASAFTRKIQRFSRSMEAAENIDSSGQGAFAEGMLAALDFREAAEAANAAIRRMLLLWEVRPDLCRRVVAEGVEAIDETSLLHAVEHILDAAGPTLVEKLAPVFREIGRRFSGSPVEQKDAKSDSVVL